MPLEQETPEPTGRAPSTTPRKVQIIFGAVFAAVMLASSLTTHAYYQSLHIGSSDWPWLWLSVSGVLLGVLIVFAGIYPPSHSTTLRRRVMALVGLTLTGSALTASSYYQCTDLGSPDWRGFSGYEVIITAYVVFGMVHVMRKTPRDRSGQVSNQSRAELK